MDCFKYFRGSKDFLAFLAKFWEMPKRDQDSVVPSTWPIFFDIRICSSYDSYVKKYSMFKYYIYVYSYVSFLEIHETASNFHPHARPRLSYIYQCLAQLATYCANF